MIPINTVFKDLSGNHWRVIESDGDAQQVMRCDRTGMIDGSKPVPLLSVFVAGADFTEQFVVGAAPHGR